MGYLKRLLAALRCGVTARSNGEVISPQAPVSRSRPQLPRLLYVREPESSPKRAA